MIRVVLADDHAMVRRALAALLGDHRDLRVAGEASSADELFDVASRVDAQVAVVDVSMPGPGIANILKRMRTDHPRLRVIVLSMFSERMYAKRALAAGAFAYLSKDQSPEHLIEAIRKVARGGRYVTPSLAELLASDIGDDERPLHTQLSDRELDVLRRIGAGKSLKEIGAALKISPKTASTYRTRLLAKLGVRTNADLVKYVLTHGLGEG